MALTFRNKELEADFAAYFGLRHCQTSCLLSVVMTLVWTARFGSLHIHSIPFVTMLTAIYSTMTTVHAFTAVAILRNASVCCSESRKAKIWVLDAIACMFTVIMFVDQEDSTRQGSKPSLLLVSLPIVVYSVHGWSIPFAGFRLVADLCLHALNLQVYVIMKFQQEWVRNGSIDTLAVLKMGCVAFCCNTLIPLTLNLVYEANVRSAFLTHRRLSQRRLPNFWLAVLKNSFYAEASSMS